MTRSLGAAGTAETGARTATGSTPHRVGTFASLANHNFRYLLAGTMAMQVGSWSQTIGQGWLIHSMTGSAVHLGMIAFIRGIVMLIASPFGGLLSDLLNRQRVVVWGTLLAAANALVLTALVALGVQEVWHLYALAAIDGAIGALNQPARQALVYDVAGKKELTNAIALSSVGGNVMRIVGPSLAGGLIGVAGIASCFLFQGVCYAFSAVVTFFIPRLPQAATRAASLADSLLGGFGYARRNRVVVLLLVVGAIPSLLVYPYVGFVPVFASDVLHVDAFQYGILMTAVGVGSIPGAIAAANMTNTAGKGRWLILTSAGYMAMIAAFAVSGMFVLAFACLVLAGVANAIQNTLNAALVQFNVTDEYRGRVSALYFMTHGLQPFGSLAMGAMIAVWGAPPAVFSFSVLATLAVLVLGALSPRLRTL